MIPQACENLCHAAMGSSLFAFVLMAVWPGLRPKTRLELILVFLVKIRRHLFFLVRPPPSLKFAGKHSIWISKMALPFTTCLPSWAIEVAVIFVSPDALQFFRAPLQPGGTGVYTWIILREIFDE